MAVKERYIGALYIDGKKVADKCEEIVETVELDMDFRDRALSFPEKLTVTFSDFRLIITKLSGFSETAVKELKN